MRMFALSLVITFILGMFFHWALGFAWSHHVPFMDASSFGGAMEPNVHPDADIPSVVDEESSNFEVPEASDRQINHCGTCGRPGRRRRNGKPYCFDCELEPWLWE